LRKGYVLTKRLRLAVIIVLSLCFFVPAETIPAKNEEIIARGSDFAGSDPFYFQKSKQYRAVLGIRNLEPHSFVLINKGLKSYEEDREEEATAYFNAAKELSPDLPIPYLYLSRAHFSLSLQGFYKASAFIADAWNAFQRNFWWSFRTYGMVLISLFLALYISIIVFSASLILSKFNLYIHDLIEDKRRILLLLPSFVLVFLGPVFGVAGLMVPFWGYLKAKERTAAYSCLIILILMVAMLPFLSSFPGVFQDKTLQDIIKINNGTYTGDSFKMVSIDKDFEYSFSYAVGQKRKGNYDEAINIYNELLNHGLDAEIYNNIANCYVGLGNYDKALEYYNKAIEKTKIASAFYNISQLYTEIFNFDEAKKYYELALNANPGKVALYRTFKGGSANSLVVDETLGNEVLWDLALKQYPYYESSIFLRRMLSFINRGFSITLLLIIFVFHMFRKKNSYGAYRCIRCGKIFCGNCEKRISHEHVCITCFHTLVKVSELGAKERIERILEIQGYREKLTRHLKVLTLIFPGSGHIYYGWPIYGFLLLLLFTFFLSSVLLWFYFPFPAAMNHAASYIRWISVAGFIAVYFFAVKNVFRRVPRKWL